MTLSSILKQKLSAGLAPVAIGFLAGSMLLAACTNPSVPPGEDPVISGILSKSLVYLKSHHADAAHYITDNLTFVRASSTGKGRLGYAGETFSGGAWVISIGHPVVPNYSWEINANFNNGQIVWVGQSKNGDISEVSYTANR